MVSLPGYNDACSPLKINSALIDETCHTSRLGEVFFFHLLDYVAPTEIFEIGDCGKKKEERNDMGHFLQQHLHSLCVIYQSLGKFQNHNIFN